ncbi:MAG: hypothetical protein LBK95_16345 [Bifidobacteriaceae bacterium]|jgi:hypothetical protein|nr:hypothetical protein [Bifidobacteriaceae bacterium]
MTGGLAGKPPRLTRDDWFRSEREASRLDALNPEAMAEQALWEETDEDLDDLPGDGWPGP